MLLFYTSMFHCMVLFSWKHSTAIIAKNKTIIQCISCLYDIMNSFVYTLQFYAGLYKVCIFIAALNAFCPSIQYTNIWQFAMKSVYMSMHVPKLIYLYVYCMHVCICMNKSSLLIMVYKAYKLLWNAIYFHCWWYCKRNKRKKFFAKNNIRIFSLAQPGRKHGQCLYTLALKLVCQSADKRVLIELHVNLFSQGLL